MNGEDLRLPGAVIGGIVALVAWIGLWLYVRLLFARLERAEAELAESAEQNHAAGLTVVEVPAREKQDAAGS